MAQRLFVGDLVRPTAAAAHRLPCFGRHYYGPQFQTRRPALVVHVIAEGHRESVWFLAAFKLKKGTWKQLVQHFRFDDFELVHRLESSNLLNPFEIDRAVPFLRSVHANLAKKFYAVVPREMRRASLTLTCRASLVTVQFFRRCSEGRSARPSMPNAATSTILSMGAVSSLSSRRRVQPMRPRATKCANATRSRGHIPLMAAVWCGFDNYTTASTLSSARASEVGTARNVERPGNTSDSDARTGSSAN